MKRAICLLLLGMGLRPGIVAQPGTAPEAQLNRYLDSIRNEKALLIAFFSAMPKGGDLHHHFSGSVYGETFLATLEQNDFWIHPATLAINATAPKRHRRDWAPVSRLIAAGDYPAIRRRLLQRWSVLDYDQLPQVSPDDQFFGSFPAFHPAVRPSLVQGLVNIRERALRENVQYIETMFTGAECREAPFGKGEDTNALLRYIQLQQDEVALYQVFDLLYQDLKDAGFAQCAAGYNAWVQHLHDSLGLEDDRFVMRYQNYVLRTQTPERVFVDMALNFESAAQSSLIVGVNIVAPEHDPVALRDYWLHMHMFRYLSRKYPKVKKALHAGELTLGLVPPEELTWHIRAAAEIAGANRIGHGVDLPYEQDWAGLLAELRRNDIAVEINLSSNAFILGVSGDEHPLRLFRRAGVPLVISTDDAGVLRNNLSEQYVRLAHDYPEVTYSDIKRLVYNSIRYSFIEEDSLKTELQRRLDEQFAAFETAMTAWMDGR